MDYALIAIVLLFFWMTDFRSSQHSATTLPSLSVCKTSITINIICKDIRRSNPQNVYSKQDITTQLSMPLWQTGKGNTATVCNSFQDWCLCLAQARKVSQRQSTPVPEVSLDERHAIYNVHPKPIQCLICNKRLSVPLGRSSWL